MACSIYRLMREWLLLLKDKISHAAQNIILLQKINKLQNI